MDGWDEDDVIAYCKRNNLPIPQGIADRSAPSTVGKKANKFHNVPTVVDGERFPSKHEAQRYEQLKLMRQAGEFPAIARQVRFLLPGGVEYVADFVLLYPSNHYVVEDAKGHRTPEYKLKRRMMKECLDLEIIET
jgi:hypothetical protein